MLPATLAGQLADVVPTLPADVAVVDCPWQFYFRRRAAPRHVLGRSESQAHARAPRCGGAPSDGALGHRPLPGLPRRGGRLLGATAIAHYWARGYRDLIEKHWRYLKLEGPDRAGQGMITGYKDIARTPVPAFWESFVRRRGYRDGLDGLLLSLLWSVYATGAKIALLLELRRRRTGRR